VRGLFKSQELFERLLKTPTLAFLNAPAAKGLFPLIIYSLGQGDYTQENVVLWSTSRAMVTLLQLSLNWEQARAAFSYSFMTRRVMKHRCEIWNSRLR